MFHTCAPLVLASASPRRQQFLRDLGLIFSVSVAQDDEPRPFAGEEPAAYALRTSAAKAASVAPRHEGAFVIAADTIVVLDGDILGKPLDEADSLRMLARLAGKTHTVITAVSLVMPDGSSESFFVASAVHFHAWPIPVLRAYAASGEPLDKAGGYAVQGLGSFLVASIDGSWTSVVGLPVSELAARLLELGAIACVMPA